jgi:hypothetical protein
MKNNQVLFFLLPALIWIIINLIIVFTRHKKSKAKIIFLLACIEGSTIQSFTHVKMKFLWTKRYKSYISLIDRCNIFVTEKFIVIIPSQSFPWHAMHHPILITKNITRIQNKFPNFNVVSPSEIILKETIKDEIEIKYNDPIHKNNKYQIRLKELTTTEKIYLHEQLENVH